MQLPTSRCRGVRRAPSFLHHVVVAPVILVASVVLNGFLHALSQEGGHVYEAVDVVGVAQPKLQLTHTSAGHQLHSLNHVGPGVDIGRKPTSASVVHEDSLRVGALQGGHRLLDQKGWRGQGGGRPCGRGSICGGRHGGCGGCGGGRGGSHCAGGCGCGGCGGCGAGGGCGCGSHRGGGEGGRRSRGGGGRSHSGGHRGGGAGGGGGCGGGCGCHRTGGGRGCACRCGGDGGGGDRGGGGEGRGRCGGSDGAGGTGRCGRCTGRCGR
mmetsp:Transcript_49883/g.82094  ORF Transcript_49883/g.82094 Transcript_49883/m.82094 type:complete len:267 (+) Transcript_49883:837-1637(+)